MSLLQFFGHTTSIPRSPIVEEPGLLPGKQAVPLLEAAGVSVRLGKTQVLESVSLSAFAGETWLLMGGNGAGKSTLLSILAGVLCPDGGTVRVGPRGTSPAQAETRRHLGYAPDVHPIDLRLSVGEYLWLMGRLQGISEHKLRDRLGTLNEQWGITEILHVPLDHCSHGMTKRVAIAAALIHDPELLLLDEPEAGLDARATTTLIETLRRRSSVRRVNLVATHQPALYVDLRPSNAWLEGGHLAQASEGRSHAH